MRKPSLKQQAENYASKYCTPGDKTRWACHTMGFKAGHRANRISAAERRVVEAAVKWRKAYGSIQAMAAREAMLAAVDALERAKGGGNG